jgi:hypothetical protein
MTAFINQHHSKAKYLLLLLIQENSSDRFNWIPRKIHLSKAHFYAAKGVSVGIEFSKKLGRGLLGEGFIMQKIEGDGLAFVHSGGTMAKKG